MPAQRLTQKESNEAATELRQALMVVKAMQKAITNNSTPQKVTNLRTGGLFGKSTAPTSTQEQTTSPTHGGSPQ